MPNHLAAESSPYLLQHQNNPVDWHPWGAEAIERAQRENKPIFLSIGYSACHWCHVMEHESFENEPIARYLNEHFVSIKVDREERPDLDQIYMNAVQIMTGRGGWPMSVFLTPDLKPFYGGTYWPPTPRMGMPGFEQVLVAVNDAWRNRREGVTKQADELTGYLQSIEQHGDDTASGGRESPVSMSPSSRPISPDVAQHLLDNAARTLRRAFDSRNGGFGSAPKFPHSMDVQLLLRLWKRRPQQDLLDMVTLTLDKMAAGGIYDHLAGGFARYSVDERWLVPHFEKMLYDNSLLTSAYLDAYLVTREERFARVVRETCEYVLTYLTDAAGGFHSTEDADSEGEEGKFYVWSPTRSSSCSATKRRIDFATSMTSAKGATLSTAKASSTCPRRSSNARRLRGWDLDESKKRAGRIAREAAFRSRPARKARQGRQNPGELERADDRRLRRAARIVQQPEYLIAAEKAANFILHQMSRNDGRLLHTWRHGQAKLDAYLDDYAYFVNALVTLYEATFNERWIDEAVRLADILIKHFADQQRGGFFFTADDHEALIAQQGLARRQRSQWKCDGRVGPDPPWPTFGSYRLPRSSRRHARGRRARHGAHANGCRPNANCSRSVARPG